MKTHYLTEQTGRLAYAPHFSISQRIAWVRSFSRFLNERRTRLTKHGLAAHILFATVTLLGISAVMPTRASQVSQVLISEVGKITAEDGRAGDWMSFDPKLNRDANLLLVGSPGNNNQAGAAYVFERDLGGPDNWGLRQKITPGDLRAGDFAAWNLAILRDASGNDTLVFGTNPDGSASGAVYIYQEVGAEWTQLKKLASPDASGSDEYGRFVDGAGDTLAVGAVQAEDKAGIVYVYERNQGGSDQWGLVKVLRAPDRAPGDQFGLLRMGGDTLLVGATGDDDMGEDSGSVYLFERHQGGEGNWGMVTKLTAFDGAPGDDFGNGLHIDSDVALISAPGKDQLGNNSGEAYVFERNRGGLNNWGLAKALLPSDLLAGDSFGQNVRVSGNIAMVPAYGDSVQKPGKLYVFHRNEGGTGNWGEAAKVVPSDVHLDSGAIAFGCCGMDLHGTLLVVGEIGDDQQGSNAGAVYLFELTQLPQLAIDPAIILSWPADAESYVLEHADTVEGPWEVVDATVGVRDGKAFVVLEASQRNGYYRLRNVSN